MTSRRENVFVLSACGQEHWFRAQYAVRSLRRFTSCSVQLIASRCDTSDAPAPVIQVDTPAEMSDAQVSRYLKTGLYRFLPRGRRYCYLDTDVFAVSPRAADVFEASDQAVVFALDPGKNVKKFSRFAVRGTTLVEAIREKFQVDVAPNWPIWNGGVFVFDERAEPLLATWHEMTCRAFRDPVWNDRDQGTLIAAVWRHQLQNQDILPKEFNWLHRLQSGLRPHHEGFRTKSGSEVALLHFPLTYGNEKYESWRNLVSLLGDPPPGLFLHGEPTAQSSGGVSAASQRIESQTSRYEVFWNGDWHGAVANRLAELMRQQGHSIVVTKSDNFPSGAGVAKLRYGICVRSTIDGVYAIIDCKDSVHAATNYVVREIAHDPLCRKILKAQYRRNLYPDSIAAKIQPYTYFEKEPDLFQRLLPQLRAAQKTTDRLYFRGSAQNFRKKILAHLRDILVEADGRLGRRDYYHEAAQAGIGLALPGYGNVCHREIEYFGMGVPTIMPRLKNEFANPLVPNRHYIAVEIDPLKSTASETASAVKDAYWAVRHDAERLQYVAREAMEWYDENVLFERSIPLTLRLLDLPS